MGKTGNLFLLLHVMSDFVGKDRFFSKLANFSKTILLLYKLFSLYLHPLGRKSV